MSSAGVANPQGILVYTLPKFMDKDRDLEDF
jgi:hypothetical protein